MKPPHWGKCYWTLYIITRFSLSFVYLSYISPVSQWPSTDNWSIIHQCLNTSNSQPSKSAIIFSAFEQKGEQGCDRQKNMVKNDEPKPTIIHSNKGVQDCTTLTQPYITKLINKYRNMNHRTSKMLPKGTSWLLKQQYSRYSILGIARYLE